MNGISAYLWRVICAAALCALVGTIGGEGPGKGLRKLTAGLFLALTVLSPLGSVELPKLNTDHIRADAETAVREGREQAERAKNTIITESLEAYICNRAAELGLDIQVRVILDEEGMPLTVELKGNASPMDREKLGSCIARELGVGKEAQIWINPYQSSE